LISVIIPTYNHMDFLPLAVLSVFKQTYKNWELIIVDDCSTDHTQEFLSGISDFRVRKIRNPVRLGVWHSVLRGVAEAGGEYFIGLSADDVLDKDALKSVRPLLQVYSPGVIFSDVEYYGLTNRIKRTNLSREPAFFSPNQLAERMQSRRYDFCCQFAVYQKAVFMNYAEFYKKEIVFADSMAFICCAFDSGVVYVPRPLLKVYHGSKTYSQSLTNRGIRESMVRINAILQGETYKTIVPLLKRSGFFAFLGGNFFIRDNLRWFTFRGIYRAFWRVCIALIS
jgi:glycosyltransferase involved in cell wall biosynthesis